MHSDNERADRDLAGRPLAEAVEAVVATRPVDRSTARSVLEPVAEDDLVTWDGVETCLDQAAEAVSTTDAAFEDLREAMDAARQAANPIEDLDIVAGRIEGVEQRFEQLEARVADLQVTRENLQTQLGGRRDLFELARQVTTLEDNAARTRDNVERLAEDVESLRAWLETPSTRHRSLEADLDALETAIAELTAAVRELEEPADQSGPDAGDSAGPDDRASQEPGDSRGMADTPSPADLDPGAVWFDARLQHLVFDLLLGDARAEYEELVEWAERVDEASSPPDALGDRLEHLIDRCEELDDDLERVVRPEWREAYGEKIEQFEHGLAPLEAPVDWATVRSALENVRPGGSQTGQS